MEQCTTRTDKVNDEGVVDIGYHYGQYHPVPQPEDADLNSDWCVNMLDFAIIGSQWLKTPGEPSADIVPLGGDGTVDINDLDLMVENWLWGIFVESFDPNLQGVLEF
jgi:hypothetical protein